MEATKNICEKGEGADDHSPVANKFCMGCKNLNHQANSIRPKSIDSEVVLKAN